MTKPLAERFFEAGYTPLVPVIPPGAPLSPNSTLSSAQLGKAPGRRGQNGTWYGFNWLAYEATLEDVKQWGQWNANTGILAAHYPGIDIDCLDPRLADIVERICKAELGPAPVRTGRAPKRLLMYRTKEPFQRVALVIRVGDQQHLLECLCAGRQYLIGGKHPSGVNYSWDCDLPAVDPNSLTWITLEDVLRVYEKVKSALELIPGVSVATVGDGKTRERTADQDSLLAPSLDALREAIKAIPNSDDLFPTRDDYIKMGFAIKAAAGEDEHAGFEIFAEWCGRHEADGRVEGNPETSLNDWRRMHPPFSVGWSWLAQIAAQCGFNPAQHEFEADLEPPEEQAPEHSDVWLADLVVREFGDSMRYVPNEGKWRVWNMGRWERDAVNLADHKVRSSLQRVALEVLREGATEQEQNRNIRLAKDFCSAKRIRDVRQIMRTNPAVTARPESFDADSWALNTPGGIVDLKTGEVREHDRDALCSRQTLVTPDYDAECPLWKQFLQEVARGDADLVRYLYRLAGYALTGNVSEHMLAFLWGPGGNGKGVFLNTLTQIWRDYAEQAPMDSFTAGMNDKHPTDVAGLLGARLVTASETQSGRRWDEARVKALTGGDPVRARFMRQDFFTYNPQFTLVFSGNHKPEIRNIDPAMRRRIHLVPFTFTPEKADVDLPEKLQAEYPAILAWAIRGCLEWQVMGLSPPPIVHAATEEYFSDEDPVQRWLDECTHTAPVDTLALDLYISWEQWCGARGEYAGNMKRFNQLLQAKQLPRSENKEGKRCFSGIALNSAFDLEGVQHA